MKPPTKVNHETHASPGFIEKQARVAEFLNRDPEAVKGERREIMREIITIENANLISERDVKWREQKLAQLYARKRELEV